MDRVRTLWAALCAIGAACGASIMGLLGGMDVALDALLTLIVLDFVVGVMQAGVDRKWNSTVCMRGVMKKVGYLIVVMIAVAFDRVTGMQVPLGRTVVVMFMVATEALSILEHLAKLGVPVPKWLLERLAKMESETPAAPSVVALPGSAVVALPETAVVALPGSAVVAAPGPAPVELGASAPGAAAGAQPARGGAAANGKTE